LKSEREAEIQSLQDKFYRSKTKLEVSAAHQNAEFWTFAANVNTHLLAAFESLNSEPYAARTVVAQHMARHSATIQEDGSALKLPHPNVQALDPNGPLLLEVAMPPHNPMTGRYDALIEISDSEDVVEFLNGGASRDDKFFASKHISSRHLFNRENCNKRNFLN
jgi:hypothetical protein